MGEKIYLRGDSMEATIDKFLKDYRANNVENMIIVWTNENAKDFEYNFIATQSCFKLQGLIGLVYKRVMDYIEGEQEMEGGS